MQHASATSALSLQQPSIPSEPQQDNAQFGITSASLPATSTHVLENPCPQHLHCASTSATLATSLPHNPCADNPVQLQVTEPDDVVQHPHVQLKEHVQPVKFYDGWNASAACEQSFAWFHVICTAAFGSSKGGSKQQQASTKDSAALLFTQITGRPCTGTSLHTYWRNANTESANKLHNQNDALYRLHTYDRKLLRHFHSHILIVAREEFHETACTWLQDIKCGSLPMIDLPAITKLMNDIVSSPVLLSSLPENTRLVTLMHLHQTHVTSAKNSNKWSVDLVKQQVDEMAGLVFRSPVTIHHTVRIHVYQSLQYSITVNGRLVEKVPAFLGGPQPSSLQNYEQLHGMMSDLTYASPCMGVKLNAGYQHMIVGNKCYETVLFDVVTINGTNTSVMRSPECCYVVDPMSNATRCCHCHKWRATISSALSKHSSKKAMLEHEAQEAARQSAIASARATLLESEYRIMDRKIADLQSEVQELNK